MGKPYEEMRQYVFNRGWRPFKMVEGGRMVLGWQLAKEGIKCQDLETAYGSAHYHETIKRKQRNSDD